MLYYQYIDIPNSNSNIILLLLILIAIKLANITIDSFADYSNRTRMGYDMMGSDSLPSILLSNITVYIPLVLPLLFH